MTTRRTGPILVCYDGSDGSRQALHSVAPLIRSHTVIVLTVWTPLIARLGQMSSFAVAVPTDAGELDLQEANAAQEASQDGARRANEQGFAAATRVEESRGPTWQTIIDVAEEVDAALIVCGTHGVSELKSLVLGSTSLNLLRHGHRPILLAPELTGA